MILQTNSYIVPKEKRAEHARLLARFRQALARLGCDHFEAYEQVGTNWTGSDTSGRFVQIMRFRDRKHQQKVQTAERADPGIQELIKQFCELINFPYQQQQGLFVVGYYSSVLAVSPSHLPEAPHPNFEPQGDPEPPADDPEGDAETSAASGDDLTPHNGEHYPEYTEPADRTPEAEPVNDTTAPDM